MNRRNVLVHFVALMIYSDISIIKISIVFQLYVPFH